MNKVLLFVVIIIPLFLLFACGTTSQEKKDTSTTFVPRVDVIDQMPGQVPAWISDTILKIEVDAATGQKMMYWNLYRTGADLNMVKRSLDGEATAQVAEAIKKLVSTQFAQAMSGDVNQSDEYIQSSITFVAKNVRLSGLMLVAEFWQKVIEKISNEDSGKIYFKVFRRYAMPYAEFVKQRDNAWQQQIKKLSPEQQKLLEKTDENLQKLDEQAELIDWGL